MLLTQILRFRAPTINHSFAHLVQLPSTRIDAMKTQIPEQLKADVPLTTMGKLLLVTPVVMTVIATLLAGLASSEMTRAQYDRAYAAQLQSKAGDQWNYFQAKKLRSAIQRNSIDLLQATAEVHPLDAATLEKIGDPGNAATREALLKGAPPAPPAATELDAGVKAALEAVERAQPESEITAILGKVENATLAAVLKSSRDNASAFDVATKPVNQAIEKLEQLFEKACAGSDRAAIRDFTVARIRYAAARYDAEARLNQAIAYVLELQVRKSNISAERHHKRSGKFFFGMLAAQAAVVVSTFSLAAQKRNFLWSVAAIAGVLAIAFAVYVFLYV